MTARGDADAIRCAEHLLSFASCVKACKTNPCATANQTRVFPSSRALAARQWRKLPSIFVGFRITHDILITKVKRTSFVFIIHIVNATQSHQRRSGHNREHRP
ncbi:MAG: hypothetical protein MSG64_01700 [Pyrinomonadaceae bacterium MAG19_C2-C3]|nr:hypothetical protein [Pyrinomonadaceae bacterium MAG19_C2-C3]